MISLEGRGEWATRDMYSLALGNDAEWTRTRWIDILVPNKKHNYAAILGVTAHIGN